MHKSQTCRRVRLYNESKKKKKKREYELHMNAYRRWYDIYLLIYYVLTYLDGISLSEKQLYYRRTVV